MFSVMRHKTLKILCDALICENTLCSDAVTCRLGRHIWSHISVMFVYGPHFIGRLFKRLVCRCRASFYHAETSDVTARARHLIGGSCPAKRCWNVSALHSTQLTDSELLLRVLRSGFCRNIFSSWWHMYALSYLISFKYLCEQNLLRHELLYLLTIISRFFEFQFKIHCRVILLKRFRQPDLDLKGISFFTVWPSRHASFIAMC